MNKEFVMQDVFHKVTLRRIKKTFDKKHDLSQQQTKEFSLPLINAKNGDNGIMYYGRMEDWESDTYCIDIVNDGAISTGNVYAQPQRTGVLYNAYMIKPNMKIESEAILLYLAKCIEKSIKTKFGYDNKATWAKVKEMAVSLPVIESSDPDHEYTVDDIDFAYMQDRIAELEQDRIAELEQDRIAELEAYLVASGLDDYELTDEDKELLSLSTKCTSDADGTVETDCQNGQVRFKKYLLGDLFESSTGDVDLQQKDINGRGQFFVNSGVGNRGIKGRTDRKAKIFPSNTITIDFWGNAYYRDFEYKMATHNHVFSLSGDVIKNRLVGLYIVSKLSKLPTLFSYNNMATWNKLKLLEISLPVNSNEEIDFDYMERYIRAIEKLAIADVVEYKNRMIATAKKVVAQGS